MIALLIYKGKTHSIDTYQNILNIWLKYYKKSKTTIPFRIFTDDESHITSIAGHKTTSLSWDFPIKVDKIYATYADVLKAKISRVMKKPFIYIDIDCIPIAPLDELYYIMENQTKPIAMARMMENLNSGIMCVKEDIYQTYTKEFFNPHLLSNLLTDNVAKSNKYLYGEQVWANVCKCYGEELDPAWNVSWKRPTKYMKAFHLHSNAASTFFSMHENFVASISYRDKYACTNN